ncbi:MAG: chromosome partitioning protein ParB, partial [Chloroflexi bacterium]|nr:chromosome partitioning protein ParB [Chloroflexota bacterium]
MLVPIDSILPDPDNLGRPIDEKSLEDIRKNGGPLGAQPVVVRPAVGQAGTFT